MLEITSTNNPKIKHILQLQKKSAVRNKYKEFVIEGKREILLAARNRYFIKTILFCPDYFSEEDLSKLITPNKLTANIIKVSKSVYNKIAYRKSTEGIMGIARTKEHRFEDIKLNNTPYILIAEQTEKPGNIGAMLRSVDGAGADAFVLVNPKVDLYNPNIIRSSLGTVFSNQIVVCNLEELQAFLQAHQIKLYVATLQNSQKYYLNDYTSATAIAVGAEDKGLSEEIRKMGQAVYIPMLGQADSLNVSVSAAVLLYEIVKQRQL